MNNQYTYTPDRNYECRIALFTSYASKILGMHGFECDESYPNSGLIVRYIHPAKGWTVAITTSRAHVFVENHTAGGIPNAYEEPFVKDLMKDGLFKDSGMGPLTADFTTPFEDIWKLIGHQFSHKSIINIFG